MKDLGTVDYYTDLHMTNFDHTIDEGLAAYLMANPNHCAQHAAREFCGYVWFENGQFYDQVWRCHVPMAEYSADTLEELMKIVNDKHGWD